MYDLWRKTGKSVLLSLEQSKANQGNCDSLKYLQKRLLRVFNTDIFLCVHFELDKKNLPIYGKEDLE